MSLTIAEARDAVCGLIETAWLADASSASIPMQWDDVKSDNPEGGATATEPSPFARTTLRIFESPAITIGANRRYQTTGQLTVQIFTPVGDGHTLGDTLKQVVTNALRSHASTSGGILYFDIIPLEVGVEGALFQYQVTASVRFQEKLPT